MDFTAKRVKDCSRGLALVEDDEDEAEPRLWRFQIGLLSVLILSQVQAFDGRLCIGIRS